MAKPELGVKRICLSCAAKFYDLEQDPIVCPSCGAPFDPEAAVKLKRGRSAANDDKLAEAKVAEKADSDEDSDDDSDDDDLVLDDDDEDILEDTSDLDDDDVPIVSQNEGDEDL